MNYLNNLNSESEFTISNFSNGKVNFKYIASKIRLVNFKYITISTFSQKWLHQLKIIVSFFAKNLKQSLKIQYIFKNISVGNCADYFLVNVETFLMIFCIVIEIKVFKVNLKSQSIIGIRIVV